MSTSTALAEGRGGRIGEPLRTGVKRSLRLYGELTAGLRGLPDFLIIGAKRGGTTSLYNYLLEHPGILPLLPSREHIKGAHYLDSNFHRGTRWYRSHFPTGAYRRLRERSGPVAVGEASPYYLFHPLAAERAASLVPDTRLIVLLRDPVERAFSHYKERVRHGAEPLCFEEALEREPERLAGEAERIVREPGYSSFAHEHHSYLAQGRYLDMLPAWLERFDRERMLILPSEDFYADPQSTVDRVTAFLGLPACRLRSHTRHNYHPAADMRPETRRRLRAQFAEHDRDLAKLLGLRLDWA
jgi:Sulfotransferase domain